MQDREKEEFCTKESNKVVIFIFYQTGFPQKAWGNDKICALLGTLLDRMDSIVQGDHPKFIFYQIFMVRSIFGYVLKNETTRPK